MEEEKDILTGSTEEKSCPEAPEEAELIDRAVEQAAESAAGEDGFFGRYVWDEETGRLYEITEGAPKKWGRLLPLLLLLPAVTALAAGIARGASLLPPECYNGASILSQSAEAAPMEGHTGGGGAGAAAEPSREEEGYTPCAIIIDGRERGVLASAEAAEALLDEVQAYFDGKVTEQGERTTELYGEAELEPRPDAAQEDISSYDELYQAFTSQRSPIKVITTVTSSETRELPFGTKTEKDPDLVTGTSITLSLGRAGSRTTVSRTVYINGEKSHSRSGSETVTTEPIDAVILRGTAKKSEGEPGRREGKEGRRLEGLSFASPIAGGEIISNYGQRDGVLHLGLDYAAKAGEPVLACEGGVVACAMQRGGYGNIIEIDHGEGFVTRYAHLDSLSVSPGDRVARGQAIGIAGSSGSCGEPRLHLELRIDGIAYNPRYYIEK